MKVKRRERLASDGSPRGSLSCLSPSNPRAPGRAGHPVLCSQHPWLSPEDSQAGQPARARVGSNKSGRTHTDAVTWRLGGLQSIYTFILDILSNILYIYKYNIYYI